MQYDFSDGVKPKLRGGFHRNAEGKVQSSSEPCQPDVNERLRVLILRSGSMHRPTRAQRPNLSTTSAKRPKPNLSAFDV